MIPVHVVVVVVVVEYHEKNKLSRALKWYWRVRGVTPHSEVIVGDGTLFIFESLLGAGERDHTFWNYSGRWTTLTLSRWLVQVVWVSPLISLWGMTPFLDYRVNSIVGYVSSPPYFLEWKGPLFRFMFVCFYCNALRRSLKQSLFLFNSEPVGYTKTPPGDVCLLFLPRIKPAIIIIGGREICLPSLSAFGGVSLWNKPWGGREEADGRCFFFIPRRCCKKGFPLLFFPVQS